MTADDPELVVAATEMRYPAAVVWIDANGDMSAANVKVPWNGELPATARAPIPRDKLVRGILEVVARDRGTVAADLAADRLHRLAASRSMPVDDPPPPPDELDVPGDPSEGKMGVPDRDRTEGQYRMHRNEPPDPEEEAAYAAREASSRVFRQRPTAGGGVPHDLIGVQGQLAPLIVASSTAPASRVAAVLLATGGALGVMRAGRIAVMPPAYEPADDDEGLLSIAPRWIEVHLERDAIRLVSVPELRPVVVAWQSGAVDRRALGDAFAKIRGDETVADILVGDGSTAQQLVDTIVALAHAGAHVMPIGTLDVASTARIAALTKARDIIEPITDVRTPTVTGNLDKRYVRRAVKAQLAAIEACYLKSPSRRGTVKLSFTIKPDGTVQNANGVGIDAAVAGCVTGVIAKIAFPRPVGGRLVQVKLPIDFRPPY